MMSPEKNLNLKFKSRTLVMLEIIQILISENPKIRIFFCVKRRIESSLLGKNEDNEANT